VSERRPPLWVWAVAVAGGYWPAEVLALYTNADAADRHVEAVPGTQTLSWLVRDEYQGEA